MKEKNLRWLKTIGIASIIFLFLSFSSPDFLVLFAEIAGIVYLYISFVLLWELRAWRDKFIALALSVGVLLCSYGIGYGLETSGILTVFGFSPALATAPKHDLAYMFIGMLLSILGLLAIYRYFIEDDQPTIKANIKAALATVAAFILAVIIVATISFIVALFI